MPDQSPSELNHAAGQVAHKRRKRYAGKYPRHFLEKYKEHSESLDPETISKVIAAGKTPAGTHRPIMVREVLMVLDPKPGEIAIDCTLGYGGHTAEILSRLQPGGRLLGLDADPIELRRAEARLRALGWQDSTFSAHRMNFAGASKALKSENLTEGADVILADLGVSSMQLDDPSRGFSVKFDGPLDMRMNPERGQPASVFLKSVSPQRLAAILLENADEAQAHALAIALAGKSFPTTRALVAGVREAIPLRDRNDVDLTVRRVFQAIRIEINDEFSALESFLRNLPACLKPGGRAAVISFHSGEDRRVKKAFRAGFENGFYQEIAPDVIRPDFDERRSNPRSTPAKLRWARRSAAAISD
ncbi:MAG TPA: 16S rRNA (cytosine(1402)-N(4))-methyltransferase RsmH [Verrucomicrobiae bacterium]|nr:16S rRNA (cytosine(1402)-N(4))-methyltransferase RsmH [Verrucomicrobiae bacterium]